MDSCVNLDYPVELHKSHSGYPLTPPKKKEMEKEWMSGYQKKMADEFGLKQSETKLVLTL